MYEVYNNNRILAQSCVTPPYILFRQRVTHDYASILDSIAKKTSCSHCFLHGASLHHCSFSRMIFALVDRKIVQYQHSYFLCMY